MDLCPKRESGAHLWRGFYDAIKHRHVERCFACGAIRELPTEEQLDDWRSEVEDALSVLQESPL